MTYWFVLNFRGHIASQVKSILVDDQDLEDKLSDQKILSFYFSTLVTEARKTKKYKILTFSNVYLFY